MAVENVLDDDYRIRSLSDDVDGAAPSAPRSFMNARRPTRMQIARSRLPRRWLAWPAARRDLPFSHRVSLLASVFAHTLVLGMLWMPGRDADMRNLAVYEVAIEVPPPPPVVMQAATATRPVEEPEPTTVSPANEPGRACPYWAAVRRRIERNLWPARALAERLTHTETVLVRLDISPSGEVLHIEILTPDATPVLVQAVLDAIRRSAPFPAVRGKPGEDIPLTVNLPVRFVPA